MLRFGPVLFLLAAGQSCYAVPMPLSNDTCTTPITNNSTVVTGWTASNSGRGTIDIVYTCVITMFLCSWSALCLQVPSEQDTRFDLLWRRLWLTFLCVLGPEFTLQMAMGQYSSARQSVKDFHAARFGDWTMKHAFYANSGGFKLATPDNFTIPIDAKQLLYLINHKYLEYPKLSVKDIDDKNKVDLLLRLISNIQTFWFIITVIARAAQGLFVTGMELTAAAFILCSFGTSFCWWNKGADVSSSLTLTTSFTMTQIILEAGPAANAPYHRTPLDFISREEWHWSLYWTHWINILRVMGIRFSPQKLPHDRFENTTWLDLKAPGLFPGFIFMCFAYTAVFVAAWNDFFPTRAELLIWRVASLGLLGSVVLYFGITAWAWKIWPAVRDYFHHQPQFEPEPQDPSSSTSSASSAKPGTKTPPSPSKRSKLRTTLSHIASHLRNNSILKDPSLDVPLKATMPMYLVGVLYCTSRSLILILDVTQLRVLPVSAFAGVEWGAFWPHFG